MASSYDVALPFTVDNFPGRQLMVGRPQHNHQVDFDQYLVKKAQEEEAARNEHAFLVRFSDLMAQIPASVMLSMATDDESLLAGLAWLHSYISGRFPSQWQRQQKSFKYSSMTDDQRFYMRVDERIRVLSPALTAYPLVCRTRGYLGLAVKRRAAAIAEYSSEASVLRRKQRRDTAQHEFMLCAPALVSFVSPPDSPDPSAVLSLPR